MMIFIIITTIVLIAIGLIGLYYQRKQSKNKPAQSTKQSSAAIKIDKSSGVVMKGNKSYGFDSLADITNSTNIDARENEAHRYRD